MGSSTARDSFALESVSHETSNRVISALDRAELENSFVARVSSIAKPAAGESKRYHRVADKTEREIRY